MRYIKQLSIVLMIGMGSSACSVLDRVNPFDSATGPASEADIIPEDQADNVVMNLVYTLAQLPDLHPVQTTVQIGEINTSLGEIVKTRLRDAGYGTQSVTSDIGNNYLKYKYENSITNDGPVTKFSVSIGGIAAERVYRLDEDKLIPDSPVTVVGSAASGLVTNDEIFGEFDKSPMYSPDTIFSANAIPEVIVLAPETTDALSELNDFAASIRRNVIDIDEQSNFQGLFENYSTIKNTVLIFENDKMTLNDSNKQLVQDFAELHDPDTDLISIVGCSNGVTEVKGGNEVLALGRANRVKEELLHADISSDYILDEGCWNSTSQENFPGRGVVIELKRKKS